MDLVRFFETLEPATYTRSKKKQKETTSLRITTSNIFNA